MKERICISSVLLIMLLIPLCASGQYSIKRKENTNIEDMNNKFDENFRVDKSVRTDYFDRAAWLAEKRRVRNERNDFEVKAALQFSLQQYENWQEGGDNMYAGSGTFYMRHKYKKDKFSSDLAIDLKYGMNVVDSTPFKNTDLLSFSENVSRSMNENWSYSGILSFRSQFANGYKSRSDRTLKSAFMAPGYLDVSLGFTYSKKDSPFKTTLSPISGSMIFVLDDRIDVTTYGLEQGKKVLNQVGPSITIKYEDKYGRNNGVAYRSTFYSFSNLAIVPIVRWENTVDINITKHLSTTLYWVLYYQKSASSSLQYQYSATIGLSYAYSNKNRNR